MLRISWVITTKDKLSLAFAMPNWEKSKKENRRIDDDRDFKQPQHQDHKKKKLKPTGKEKYRINAYAKEEEDADTEIIDDDNDDTEA